MLIECPNCNAKYDLPSEAFGAKGREMRCVKCDHEWFQTETGALASSQDTGHLTSPQERESFDPPIPSIAMLDTEQEEDVRETDEPLEPSIDDDDSGTSIPDGIKPIDDNIEIIIGADSDLSDVEENEKPQHKKTSAMAKANGIFAAILIWLVIAGAMVLWRGPILSAWPKMAGVYDMVGIELPLKGREFVVESLNATLEKHDNGKAFIVLKGRVLNMSSKPVTSPKMVATLHDTSGKKVGSWIIEAPSGIIEPGAGFSISSDNPALSEDISDVRLSFMPEFKH